MNAPALTRLDTAVLEARAIVAGYGARTVLDGVSIALRPGGLVGIVGPNGSGKTTLVRVLAGVLKPRHGAVLLDGSPLASRKAAAIARRIAVVPQGAELPAMFTGMEIVLQGRTPHLRLLEAESARDFAIARQAMAACDATHLVTRPVGELSGGERQRLLLARALTQEPAVLLLDEPTTYLDIAHQVATLDLVRGRCRAGGLAAVAVLHDLTLAAQCCDHLVLLDGGRVRAEGNAEQVLTEPILQAVYGARVSVWTHPQTGKPVVVPLAGGAESA